MTDDRAVRLALDVARVRLALEVLVRRGVVTTEPDEATECCGLERDDDGFCVHRPYHPAYVSLDGK